MPRIWAVRRNIIPRRKECKAFYTQTRTTKNARHRAARFFVSGSRRRLTAVELDHQIRLHRHRIRHVGELRHTDDRITSYNVCYTKLLCDAPETPHLYIHARFVGGGTEVRDLAKSGGLKALLDAAGIAAQPIS